MKSLVFHGNGCTIFNSKGEVVYRVDNYQQRCSAKVFLMDSSGNVLFSINRKKLWIFGCWEGYKWNGNSKVSLERPWFQVRRNLTILSRDICCNVNQNPQNGRYKIIGFKGKSALKIIDHFSGQLLAEAVQKQSSSGVCLGEDVLSLMVEPKADQSLIMALVTVYGLINDKM
ncbi:protein lurp-one-related 4 [Phtheirospermum japonicum]|uniref:Protein lurp-one-related 4 n=1 Tax=Phtheirospermum japonicum TaxID=374723 RepID=A0A830DSU1_9LAMI|nr:protein lurp-one-related 4 [Phtheirospermum japonicum]